MDRFLGRRRAMVLRVAFLSLFVAFLVYATFFARWRPHGLEEVKAELAAFGPASRFMAVALQAVGLVLLIPGSLLVLAAAILFGLDAIWISLLGQVLGSTLTYLIGRHFGRDLLHALLGRRMITVERALEGHAFRTLFLLRLAGIFPGAVLHYAPGLVRAPLRQVLAAVLGDLPVIVVLTLVGRSVAGIHSLADVLHLGILMPLILLVLLLTVPVLVFLTVRHQRALGRKSDGTSALGLLTPEETP